MSAETNSLAALTRELQEIADSTPGQVGVAYISPDGDTVLINNTQSYPLMSVYKLHQAIAAFRFIEKKGISPDSLVCIPRLSLDSATWSPMLDEIKGDTLSLSLRQLIVYSLEQSDNNASNYLFNRLQKVEDVDTFIATLIPRQSFKLSYTEAEMMSDHSLAADNFTSPFGAALLLDLLYSDSIPLTADDTSFLRQTLQNCQTGTDRIVAPLKDIPGVIIGHKTGSGYIDDGILAAHNDVARVTLPDGRHYTLAVFVKDFAGTTEQASRLIARISSRIFRNH